MELTWATFLIVCPMVFLAGFVDAIGGGGGLISLPAYYLAGVPIHHAIATNKMSSTVGTVISAVRICKNIVIRWKLIAPAIALALIGSTFGTHLSMMADEQILKNVLMIVLPVVAFLVLRKNSIVSEKTQRLSEKKEAVITWGAALVIGTYDGFYGPGTGTFMILALLGIAHMTSMEAAAYTKILNLSSNLASLVTFLLNGQAVILLGLAAGVFSIAGHYMGSGLVLKNGTKIIRPIIFVVLILMFVKILFDL
ncbi:MAG: TSUP family transporter [Lachnospiraceae bacterium]|nr:TSUP family transporter [Lachnospiraceae bacterium]